LYLIRAADLQTLKNADSFSGKYQGAVNPVVAGNNIKRRAKRTNGIEVNSGTKPHYDAEILIFWKRLEIRFKNNLRLRVPNPAG